MEGPHSNFGIFGRAGYSLFSVQAIPTCLVFLPVRYASRGSQVRTLSRPPKFLSECAFLGVASEVVSSFYPSFILTSSLCTPGRFAWRPSVSAKDGKEETLSAVSSPAAPSTGARLKVAWEATFR